MPKLELRCYNGMMIPLSDEDDDLATCRRKAADHIRYHANEIGPVTILTRGHSWELETAEDAFAIGDHEGTLVILDARKLSDRDDFDDYFDDYFDDLDDIGDDVDLEDDCEEDDQEEDEEPEEEIGK